MIKEFCSYESPCTVLTAVQAEGCFCTTTSDDVIKNGDNNQVIINRQEEGGEFTLENWDE